MSEGNIVRRGNIRVALDSNAHLKTHRKRRAMQTQPLTARAREAAFVDHMYEMHRRAVAAAGAKRRTATREEPQRPQDDGAREEPPLVQFVPGAVGPQGPRGDSVHDVDPLQPDGTGAHTPLVLLCEQPGTQGLLARLPSYLMDYSPDDDSLHAQGWSMRMDLSPCTNRSIPPVPHAQWCPSAPVLPHGTMVRFDEHGALVATSDDRCDGVTVDPALVHVLHGEPCHTAVVFARGTLLPLLLHDDDARRVGQRIAEGVRVVRLLSPPYVLCLLA